MPDHRVCFDFGIRFSNGGGIQGQDFRRASPYGLDRVFVLELLPGSCQ